MSAVSADGLTEAERRLQVWSNLRLVAVDTETTGSGHSIRVVSVAAITVRNRAITGTWATLVNPGVPITKSSINIHGITDDHVANEPSFDEVAGQLIATLTARPGERVVFVAHNASFDLGALRAELNRHPDEDGVLLELPDVPVLDTSSDELHTLAGIRPKRRKLAVVAEHLGVPLSAAHNAAGDAMATAHVATRLIDLAVAAGHSTFESIHAAIGAKTTGTHATSTALPRDRRQVTLSEAHATTHLRRLPAEPSDKDWNQWKADVLACAASACPRLVDRLQAAPYTTDHDWRLKSLVRQLATPDDEGRVRSAVLNTVAHALAGNIARPIHGETDKARREQARTALRRWSELLEVAQRCHDGAQCPGCAADEECGRDTWWRPLVPALRGSFPKVEPVPAPTSRNKAKVDQAKAAYRSALTGVDRWFRPDLSASVLTTNADLHRPSTNYAVWTIVEWHLAAGRLSVADELAARAVAHGYYDPRVVNHHLTHLTSARRAGDISTALDICAKALSTRDGSTDVGWLLLTSRQAHLAGLQERLTLTYSGQVDEDGNPIPKRRHHPAVPRRTRPLRFARDPNQNRPTTPGDWVRINEAARRLNTTTLQVAKLADSGDLLTTTVNGLRWFDANDLDKHRTALASPELPTRRSGAVPPKPLRKQTYRPRPTQTTKPRTTRSQKPPPEPGDADQL